MNILESFQQRKMTFVHLANPSYFRLAFLSQPLTLLNQNLVLLLVYASQPERPAAPTAVVAKTIRT